MKFEGHLPAAQHRDILRQKVIQCPHEALAGNDVFRFETDAEFPRMYEGICAAASFNIRFFAEHLVKRFLKNLLYRNGILLYLPAMVVSSVVTNRQQ